MSRVCSLFVGMSHRPAPRSSQVNQPLHVPILPIAPNQRKENQSGLT